VSWKLRGVFALLIFLLAMLQFRLWVGEGSVAEVRELKRQIAAQQLELEQLQQRNEALRAEVQSLKEDDAAIEARARRELGMIREGETYFQLIKPGNKDD
jgi:cell division protein FtsB